MYTHPSLVSTTTCVTHTSANTAASTALLAKDAAAVPVGATSAKSMTLVVEVAVVATATIISAPLALRVPERYSEGGRSS